MRRPPENFTTTKFRADWDELLAVYGDTEGAIGGKSPRQRQSRDRLDDWLFKLPPITHRGEHHDNSQNAKNTHSAVLCDTHEQTGANTADSRLERNSVLCDVDTVRLAVALRLPAVRLWLAVLGWRRQQQRGFTYITLDTVLELVRSHDMLGRNGTCYTRRHVRRLLAAGNGVFWHMPHEDNRIFFASQARVAMTLVQLAEQAGKPELVVRDKPGRHKKPRWYVSLSGSLKTFHAAVYAAWLASRDKPQISRDTLEAVWSRTRQQLQVWEQMAGVIVTANYAQCPVDTMPPDSAENVQAIELSYPTGNRQPAYSWQLPNSYRVLGQDYGRAGVSRKVRSAVNSALMSADNAAVGHTQRRYFDDAKVYQRVTRKKPGTDDFLQIGRRGQVGIHEYMPIVAQDARTDAVPYGVRGDL